MYQLSSEFRERLGLFRRRFRVAFDLFVVFSMVIGTLLYSVALFSDSASGLYLILVLLLNGSMMVFVFGYLYNRIGDW